MNFLFPGGGFFVERSGVWFMRGIVSAATLNAMGFCDVDTYSLFTKMEVFLDWVTDTINESS